MSGPTGPRRGTPWWDPPGGVRAVRILARAWIPVIYCCWIEGVPYDTTRHGNAATVSPSAAA